MEANTNPRRRSPRIPQPARAEITLAFASNGQQPMTARLVDLSEWGLGVETLEPLQVGAAATASGSFFSKNSALGTRRQVRVVHCRSSDGDAYRSGLAFEDTEEQTEGSKRAVPVVDSSFADHYEALQISPNADLETVQRVYRHLAHRYHPDNSETGNEEAFRIVLQAFHVLSDPEKRAAYDVQYRASRTLRWKVFDQANAARGIEAEKKARLAILSILRTKRLQEPAQPGVSVRDLEALLGCPREYLEFSLWYLRAKGFIAAADNGRYAVTAEGVDAAEHPGPSASGNSRLLLKESESSPERAE